MRGFMFLLCFVSGLLSFSCYEDFEQPRVTAVYPEHNSMNASPDSPVIVEFSAEMDSAKTVNEFSLSTSSGKIDGFFAWEKGNSRLIFTPREPLVTGESYSIRITTGAEDIKGNDLKNEFVSVFYINSDLDMPFAESHSPGANSIGNPPLSDVVIEFSEPLDINTVYSGISILPSVQGYFVPEAGGSIIRYVPLYGFTYGVTYTVNVSRSVLDLAGNKLRSELTFNFTVGDDFEGPTISLYQDCDTPLDLEESIIIQGAEKDRDIVINFSEIVKTADISRAVSITPSAGFFVTTSTVPGAPDFTRGVIHFTGDLTSEETYTLNISSIITDLQGNPLGRDYRFRFTVNGPGSVAPYVSAIGGIGGPDWMQDEIPVFTLDGEGSSFSNIVRVDFSRPVNPVTLSISAEKIMGSGVGSSPSVIGINWSADFTQLTFKLRDVMHGNIYRIKIKGGSSGLKDHDGNFMKEDFVQMLRI